MLRLNVRTGTSKGQSFAANGEVVRIGRGPANDLVLGDTHVSAEHARIYLGPATTVVEDLQSTNGTAVMRRGVRIVLGESAAYKTVLEGGDVVELGTGDATTQIEVVLEDDREDARVVAVRKIDELGRITAGVEENSRSLSALY